MFKKKTEEKRTKKYRTINTQQLIHEIEDNLF